MAELVADCPRCGARKMTFDVKAMAVVNVHFGWMREMEAFCVCRACGRSTVFVLHDRCVHSAVALGQENLDKLGAINDHVNAIRYISQRDHGHVGHPAHEGRPAHLELVGHFPDTTDAATAGPASGPMAHWPTGFVCEADVDLASHSPPRRTGALTPEELALLDFTQELLIGLGSEPTHSALR